LGEEKKLERKKAKTIIRLAWQKYRQIWSWGRGAARGRGEGEA
jgi:hypothetical protein